MLDVNYIREQTKMRIAELKSAKSFGIITFSNFENLLNSDSNMDLVRQIINLPKDYQSVRVLLQPYLAGKEQQIFGKRYQTIQYKIIPRCLSRELNNLVLENKICCYDIMYSELSWPEVEEKVKFNGFPDNQGFEFFLKLWNYKELPNKSVYDTNGYNEFAENLGRYRFKRKK